MGGVKNKTTVRIAGNDYPMSGYESEEYMHRVAILVDRKITDMQRLNPALSSSHAAVLAAVNIADEMLKLREENESLEEKLVALRKEALDPAVKPAQKEASGVAAPLPGAQYSKAR